MIKTLLFISCLLALSNAVRLRSNTTPVQKQSILYFTCEDTCKGVYINDNDIDWQYTYQDSSTPTKLKTMMLTVYKDDIIRINVRGNPTETSVIATFIHYNEKGEKVSYSTGNPIWWCGADGVPASKFYKNDGSAPRGKFAEIEATAYWISDAPKMVTWAGKEMNCVMKVPC